MTSSLIQSKRSRFGSRKPRGQCGRHTRCEIHGGLDDTGGPRFLDHHKTTFRRIKTKIFDTDTANGGANLDRANAASAQRCSGGIELIRTPLVLTYVFCGSIKLRVGVVRATGSSLSLQPETPNARAVSAAAVSRMQVAGLKPMPRPTPKPRQIFSPSRTELVFRATPIENLRLTSLQVSITNKQILIQRNALQGFFTIQQARS